VAEADHVGLITRMWYDLFIRRFIRKSAVPSVSAVPTRNPARCRSP